MHGSPLVRSLVVGLTAFRAACLVWLVAVVLATSDQVVRPGAAVAHGGGDLGVALRHVAARTERRDGTTVRVVIAPDVPDLPATTVEAIASAVGEACTNAAKHGAAATITVYAEPDGDALRCSIKDDGCGFDGETTTDGVGLSRSVRGRIGEVGGHVDVDPNPGHGTEVRLHVPLDRRTVLP